VLLVWVALCFHYYIYTQYVTELEITRNIELANWQKLKQLESNIGQNKRILSRHQKVVDMVKEQVCTPLQGDSQL
jgi:hypothetical protein